MSDDRWLYLNTVRNPHLVLAEALQDWRRTEWGSLNSGDWYASDNGDIGRAMMFPHEQQWHKWRVQRRQQSDELGPCPVCGAEFGIEWVKPTDEDARHWPDVQVLDGDVWTNVQLRGVDHDGECLVMEDGRISFVSGGSCRMDASKREEWKDE